jgi:hypothetical protein
LVVGATDGCAGDAFGGGEESVDGQGVVQVPDVGRVKDQRFDVEAFLFGSGEFLLDRDVLRGHRMRGQGAEVGEHGRRDGVL